MEQIKELANNLFKDYLGHMQGDDNQKWRYIFTKIKREVLRGRPRNAIVFDLAVQCHNVDKINKTLSKNRKKPLQEEAIIDISHRVLNDIYDRLESELDKYYSLSQKD